MRRAIKPEFQEFPVFDEAVIHAEEGPRMCGLAVVRTILDYQFGIKRSEEEAIDRFCVLAGYSGTTSQSPNRIRASKRWFCEHAPGYFPSQIAQLVRQEVRKPVRVFCSRHGSINLLDQLLNEHQVMPVTHQMVSYDEDGSREPRGHYMFYCGNNGPLIRFFDPSVDEGFKILERKHFLDMWTNPLAGNERWYMAILPERVKLDPHHFQGKYI
jgi:hypothetical protein